MRLDPINASAAGAVAIGNAKQDAELSGIDYSATALETTASQVPDGGVALIPKATDFLNSLSNVMSKLDLFVQIVDKTAKASITRVHMIYKFMMASAGPPIRHFRLASDIVALSGPFTFGDHLAVISPTNFSRPSRGSSIETRSSWVL